MRRKLNTILALSALLAAQGWAGTRTFTFDDWPFAVTNLTLASSQDLLSKPLYYAQTFGGNPDLGGFLELTPAAEGRNLAVIFPDIDDGVPVKAFKITADLRVGNGTETPADGFSISYVRESDVALSNALNQTVYAGSDPVYDPRIGLLRGFAGGDSLAAAQDPQGGTNPESGTKTGVSISFDAYKGNWLPDTGPETTGGGNDIVGISVRVDDVTLIQKGLNEKNFDCSNTNSMQTGPYDTNYPNAWQGLSWCRLEVEKTADNKVSVTWKGAKILDNFQLPTYSVHRGRLILAGRTGGAWQNVHFDNITLETVPGIEATIEGLTIAPDFKGWTIALQDTGASQVTNITQVIWNGVDVTSSVVVSKDGTRTTGVYTQATRLPSGSTNQVQITFRTSLNQTLSGIANASTPGYTTIPVAYALPLSAVSGQTRGIALGSWQTIAANNNSQGDNRLNWTEEQILGLHGANLISGAWPTSIDVLDYQNDANGAGNFQVNGSTDVPPIWDGPDYAITSLGFASNPLKGNDEDGTIEWFAYVNFPTPGVYYMTVNSDDGFRLTTARNAKDRMGEVVSSYEGGRGAGTGLNAGTMRRIVVDQAGVYPMRGFIENRGGGFNVEWYTQVGDQLVLVNSTAAGALEAWQSATGTGCYVQSAIPVRSAVDVRPTQKISIELANGTTTVNAGTVALKVDGVAVAPTITPGTPLKVEQAPVGPRGFWAAGNHTVELSFTDSANNVYNYQWSFTVGAYQFYQAPFGAGGKWNVYMVIRNGQTWVEAEAIARTMVEPLSGQNKTGHLVTISSREEADFVRMIATGQSVWIGLTDNEAYGGEETGGDAGQSSQVPPVSGKWVWVTGEPYTFARWNGGEPNNAGSFGEDAIELVDNGNFNDNGIGFGGEGAPKRQYVVEFETLLSDDLADVQSTGLPAGPLPGPVGCDGKFGIRVIRDSGTMPSLAAAVASLSNAGATIIETDSPFVNFNDLDGSAGGGGIFGNELPLPGNRTGEDNDFVIVAKGRIVITEAGDYTFGVHSDDGFALRIRGQNWKSISGAGVIDPGDPSTIIYQFGTGDANTRGVITLAVGEYDLEFLWFEGGGGCYSELYAAKGAWTCDMQTGDWRLLGYQPANPPAMLVDVGVSPAGWTVEYSTPGANGNLNNIAEAEAALVGAPSVTGVTELNFQDPDGGGGPGCSAPFPQNTVGVADDDYAIRATAQLVIPVAGTYHFGFQGDDGGYLQIEGQTWDAIVATADPAQGVINGDRIQFNVNTGNSRTVGAITLAAGTYTIRVLFWERGGGAWVWAFGGQAGSYLSSLTANNSPVVPDTGVALAACTARPALSLVKDGGVWKIQYTGTLLSSPTVDGTYTPVTGATSPYTLPTGSPGAQFYRSGF